MPSIITSVQYTHRLIRLYILTLLIMVAESIIFESLTITVKYTIIIGLEFKNMVQFVMSTGDQFPSLLHCLPIWTPERKLGCNSEQGWVTNVFVLLLIQNKAPEKSLAQTL